MASTEAGILLVAIASLLLAPSLVGCGGGATPTPPPPTPPPTPPPGPPTPSPPPPPVECAKSNLTCRVQKSCNDVCHNFNITTKAVAEACFECAGKESVKDAKENCLGDDQDVEKCVSCITKTSVTCWTNPFSIGGCILGPCRVDRVIEDPLACPKCWVGYVDGCLEKYPQCFNATPSPGPEPPPPPPSPSPGPRPSPLPPGECANSNLTCRVQKSCNAVCHNFNITTKAVAEACFECAGKESVKDAKENCLGDEQEIEECVSCITKTSVTCWTNPFSIGGCILGPCRVDRVIEDPLACPKCWVGYVDGCLEKYPQCFNTTTRSPEPILARTSGVNGEFQAIV